MSKGSFQTSAPSDRKKRRRRDGGRQPNHSGSLENLTQQTHEEDKHGSSASKEPKKRGKRRDGRGNGGLNRSGSLQDILKSSAVEAGAGAKKKKKEKRREKSKLKLSGSLQDLTEGETVKHATSKRRLKKSGSASLMEFYSNDSRDDVVPSVIKTADSVAICVEPELVFGADLRTKKDAVCDDGELSVEMQDVSSMVINKPSCRPLSDEDHKLMAFPVSPFLFSYFLSLLPKPTHLINYKTFNHFSTPSMFNLLQSLPQKQLHLSPKDLSICQLPIF